jgi:hypothetical protein
MAKANFSASHRRHRRRPISLKTKRNIVIRQRQGEKQCTIATIYRLNPSIISRIVKNGDKIIEAAATAGRNATKIMRQRKGALPDLEQLVFQWFCRMRQNHIPITQEMIQKTGLRIVSSANAELYPISTVLEGQTAKNIEIMSDFKCSLNWVARFRLG